VNLGLSGEEAEDKRTKESSLLQPFNREPSHDKGLNKPGVMEPDKNIQSTWQCTKNPNLRLGFLHKILGRDEKE